MLKIAAHVYVSRCLRASKLKKPMWKTGAILAPSGTQIAAGQASGDMLKRKT